jgi:hypothetical protein
VVHKFGEGTNTESDCFPTIDGSNEVDRYKRLFATDLEISTAVYPKHILNCQGQPLNQRHGLTRTRRRVSENPRRRRYRFILYPYRQIADLIISIRARTLRHQTRTKDPITILADRSPNPHPRHPPPQSTPAIRPTLPHLLRILSSEIANTPASRRSSAPSRGESDADLGGSTGEEGGG